MTWRATVATHTIGQRVRLTCEVERWDVGIVPTGTTGTVVAVPADGGTLAVKVDKECREGLEGFESDGWEVQWILPEDADDFVEASPLEAIPVEFKFSAQHSIKPCEREPGDRLVYRNVVKVYTVEPSVDRRVTGGWTLYFSGPGRALVGRLIKAIEAGAVCPDPEVKVDVDGQTYVDSGCNVRSLTMKADLTRLGF